MRILGAFAWLAAVTSPAQGLPAQGGMIHMAPLVDQQGLGEPLQAAAGPSQARAQRRQHLQAALSRGFGVQYWGRGYTPEALAQAPHGVLILEATRHGATEACNRREIRFTRDEIARISHDGARPVIGYLNVTEIETYRDYWVREVGRPLLAGHRAALPDWVGPRTATGEALANFWLPDWEALLIQRIDALLDAGMTGIFLDDVLHYYSFLDPRALVPVAGAARVEVPAEGSATAMLHLVLRLTGHIRARRPDAVVIVNNGAFIGGDAAVEGDAPRAARLFDAYLGAIDAVLVESALGPLGQDATRTVLLNDYGARGVPVMAVEFLSQHPGRDAAQVRRDLAASARQHGFALYLAATEGFDRLSPPTLTRLPPLPPSGH